MKPSSAGSGCWRADAKAPISRGEMGAFASARLNVYRDVVVDGRGTKPVDPQEVLRPRHEREFRREDIGYLTRPVRLKDWIATIRSRCSFLAHLDADEQRWTLCSERDLHEVETALASFRAHT